MDLYHQLHMAQSFNPGKFKFAELQRHSLICRRSLQSVLTCPNRCGSIPISGACGLGVLIAEGADADCFSKARDVVPNGQIVTEKPSAGTFNTIGCWTDSVSARALTGGSSSDQAMTLEMCVGLAQGYQYAGLEYGV